MKIPKKILLGLRENILAITISLIIYITAFTTIPLSGWFLENNEDIYFVRPYDVILNNIDQSGEFVLIGEIASIATVLLLWYTVIKYNFKPLPEYLLKSAFVISLRSLTIILTPLAQIQDAESNGSLPLVSTQYHGMFYSGHTAGAFLILFLDKSENKKIKLAKLFFASLTAVSLLLSHSHYSIDIVGGILASFAISKLTIPAKMRKKFEGVILN